jgi:hypothetical protein
MIMDVTSIISCNQIIFGDNYQNEIIGTESV